MMIHPSIFSSARRSSLALLFTVAAAWACAGESSRIFGLSPERLGEILRAGDIAPALAWTEEELKETGDFGAEAYYYLARWIESRAPRGASADGDREMAMRLYRRAYEGCVGFARRVAGEALMDCLLSKGLWEDFLAFSAELARDSAPEWSLERPRLDALDALQRDVEEKALILRLRAVYPRKSADDAAALSYFEATADLRSSGQSWRKAFRIILLESPLSDWTDRAGALARSDPRLGASFSADELHAVAMRLALSRKDYGEAYREALLANGSALSPSVSKSMLADAGKAFLYSGMANEGRARFVEIEKSLGESSPLAWALLFYRARFARALEAWDEATELFDRAAKTAPSVADADSCRWYAADSAYRGANGGAPARDALLARLVDASAAWKGPGAFADLAAELLRDSIKARDWPLIEGIAERLGPRLSPDLKARVRYLAARSLELNLAAASAPDPMARATEIAQRFASIAKDEAAPLYYRALAAWRAGIEPGIVPALEESAGSATQAPRGLGAPGDAESFLGGMARFGIEDLAFAETRERMAQLSAEGLRKLAALFASRGYTDYALRLGLELSYRSAGSPRRSDYELLYPRPYLAELRALGLESKLPEALAYGLIRSESLFDADAKSRAGAIGLSQIMPPTAEEQARKLKLEGFDLVDPRDNLAIGLSYFATLLDRAGDRPLRAMMAYNAGWSRQRAWVAESGELPDDVLVEAIDFEETRRYCRNILQSTVVYGLLDYGMSVSEAMDYLVEGRRSSRAESSGG